MIPNTRVKLKDVTFSYLEVPEQIPFGGSQALVVHQLVGGARVVDAMGADSMPLEWSGMFYGPTALDRARYVDLLRIQGLPIPLTWSELNYTVIVKTFQANYQRFYKIPYTISCLVVQDNTRPAPASAPQSFDDAIQADLNSCNGFTTQIGDSTLTSLMGTLNSAISSVNTFASASRAVISSVLTPLAAVQSRVGILVAAAGNTIGSVTTLGGVFPGNPIAANAASLLNQVVNMNNLPILRNLQSVAGRMAGNLNVINAPPNAQSVTVAGGNLYSIASEHYGDPTMWTTIAQANGLTDPQLPAGMTTLLIPPAPQVSSGGLLSA